LLRTAHAAGAAALIVTGASDPFHPRATRTSRGSIFKLPVIDYESAADMLADLRRNHVCAVATTAEGGQPLPEMVWPRDRFAILMGNEASGLAPEVASLVDYQVSIPMTKGIDSFSVNAAAAIILYAARHASMC
jgi:RNA methyltransferase, TrmH family